MHPVFFWAAAILALVCAFRCWWAKPTAGAWAGGILAFAAAAGFAGWCTLELRLLDRKAKPYYVEIPVEPPGRHVLKLKPVEGVPGLHVRWVKKGTRLERMEYLADPLPSTLEQIREAGWKVRTPSGHEFHVHDWTCRCSPKDFLADSHYAPDLTELEVEYEVTEKSRPVLEALDLQISYPLTYGNDLAMGGGCLAVVRFGAGGLAAVALLGLAILTLRVGKMTASFRQQLRAPDPSRSDRPSPPSPGRT